MSTPKVPLIDDPKRLWDLARGSGDTAATNEQPRVSPFYSPELTLCWLGGYDDRKRAQTRADVWAPREPKG